MSTINPIKRLWYKWRALRFPWRRKWLAGFDLSGTTFWEMQSDVSGRTRRMAKTARRVHPADVHITPSWHQWLRHTRVAAPTVEEQVQDVHRQQGLQQLAAAADQRWAEKPTYLDRPEDTEQIRPELQPRDKGGYAIGGAAEDGRRAGVRSMIKGEDEAEEDVGTGEQEPRGTNAVRPKVRQDNPMESSKRRGGPSDGWTPESWSPQTAGRG